MEFTQEKFDGMKTRALYEDICKEWEDWLSESDNFDELMEVSGESKASILFNYAHDVRKGRFREGEAAIAKDAFYSYYYAKQVIHGRFIEGEAAIAKDARYSYLYAKLVIKGRFPEGEAAISKDVHYSYYYAHDVIKGRFIEGEAVIATDAYWNTEYKELLSTLSNNV